MWESDSSVVRVGIVGLGRGGRHHLERLSLRGDFAVTVVCDERELPVAGPLATGCRFTPRWQDVASSPDVDLAIVDVAAGDRETIVSSLLRQGKGVAVDRFLAADGAAAVRMGLAAEASGAPLAVLDERRFECEFRTARAAVESGELGALQAVRHILWSPPLVERAPSCAERPTDPAADDPLPAAAGLVDQALRLIDDEPVSVFLAQAGNAIVPGSGSLPVLAGFSLWIRFANGATAHLEVNRSAALPFGTGWLISGTKGGYRKGRLFRRQPDGEVYDVPFDEAPTDRNAMYDELRALLRSPSGSRNGLRHEIQTAAVIEAARTSAERDAPVAVERRAS